LWGDHDPWRGALGHAGMIGMSLNVHRAVPIPSGEQ
jgi:hypothetical protein